jgi:hypothetical protein
MLRRSAPRARVLATAGVAWSFGAAFVAVAPAAHAFCRTSTCPLPADFSPSSEGCQPADFAQYCAGLDPPVVPMPIWWRNACVSYDIQQNASKEVPYDVAVSSFAAAFSKWTGAACDGGGHPSIAVDNLGPVACDEVKYNDNTSGQGNQHVVIFRDTYWPHPNDMNNTLGLTTVTFDPDTGEIYDADMEINATVPLTVSDPVPAGGYDFMSIITHETGHFFGLAHATDDGATMYARYTPGSTKMRNLSADDAAGICAIYGPDGQRNVAASAATGGTVKADSCDPAPRHGFQSACTEASSQGGGCAVAAPADRGSALVRSASLLGLVAVAGAFLRRARRCG